MFRAWLKRLIQPTRPIRRPHTKYARPRLESLEDRLNQSGNFSVGTVRDGLGADIDFQASFTSLSANWSGFSDAGSGIASYEWAIGSRPGFTDIQGYTNVGAATSATATGLSVGAIYYISVRATDNAGNVSDIATSNGVEVDITPPTAGTVNDGIGADIGFQASTDTIVANWTGYADSGSGITHYLWAIGTNPGWTNVMPYTDVGSATHASATGLHLIPGQKYYVAVGAIDFVGNESASANSTGVVIAPFADDFDRANSGNLGSNWTTPAGAVTVSNQKAVVSASRVGLATAIGITLTDVVVQADIVVSRINGAHAGLVARYAGPGDKNFYLGMIYNNHGVYQTRPYRQWGGAFTQLAIRNLQGFNGTGHLRFEVFGNQLKLFVNDVLQAVAYDARLAAPGLIGLRGLASSVDKVTVMNNVAPQNATLPFADSFDNPTYDANLDRTWTERAGAFMIQNQAAVDARLGADSLATLNTPGGTDVSVQADIALGSSGTRAGLVARYTGSDQNSFYLGMVYNNRGVYQASLWVRTTWFRRLAIVNLVGFTGSGRLRLEVVGNQLKLFVDNMLQAVVYDSTLTGAGQVGVRGFGAAIDNFQASKAPVPHATTLPFSGAFAAPGGTVLDSIWTERAGTFTVQGGIAADVPSLAPVSLATLNMPRVADVRVQADIALASVNGSAAGLVARYIGPDQYNYYLAAVYYNHGVYTACIYLKHGVGSRTLAVRSLTNFSGAGTLRFEVVGRNLRLFVDGVLIASATDATLTAGQVGIRAAKASLGNFEAQ